MENQIRQILTDIELFRMRVPGKNGVDAARSAKNKIDDGGLEEPRGKNESCRRMG